MGAVTTGAAAEVVTTEELPTAAKVAASFPCGEGVMVEEPRTVTVTVGAAAQVGAVGVGSVQLSPVMEKTGVWA